MAAEEPVVVPVKNKSNDGPLAPLENPNPNGAEILSYPRTLKSARLKHYVAFAIKEVNPQSLYAIAGIASSASKEGTTVTNLQQQSKTPVTLDPAVLSTSNFGKALYALTENLSIEHNRTNAEAYINLYMPDSLKDSYQSDYASISIRDELGPLLSTIRAAVSVGDSASKADSGKMVQAISSDPAAIKFAIDTFVGALGGGGGISEAILQAQGYTSNPQLQMIYRGSYFRQFSLEFLFTPVSKEEAEDVRRIIYLFKFFAAPTITAGQKAKGAMFLIPPSLFEIKFMKDESENINLPKYTDCVLEDVSVDYAPNGFAVHEKDGAPIQTHLTLTFQEVEIVDRERLSAGYSSADGSTADGIGGLR